MFQHFDQSKPPNTYQVSANISIPNIITLKGSFYNVQDTDPKTKDKEEGQVSEESLHYRVHLNEANTWF